MLTPKSFKVAGADGCKAGWLVVVASPARRSSRLDPGCALELKRFFVAATFAEVLSQANDCKLVCVDIPIGLTEGGKPRECDIAARKVLRGRRASSVFPVPIRPCLSAKDCEMASNISLEHCGKRLNRQSFAILEKIRQVDGLMTPLLQRRVREIHPEISFWALNNKTPVLSKKKTLAGRVERIKLLSPIFSDLENFVAKVRIRDKVAADDVLDAVVAAWTAIKALIGKTKTLPDNPELDSKGLRMEIIYPAG